MAYFSEDWEEWRETTQMQMNDIAKQLESKRVELNEVNAELASEVAEGEMPECSGAYD